MIDREVPTYYVCPYCDSVHDECNAACCGEVGHLLHEIHMKIDEILQPTKATK